MARFAGEVNLIMNKFPSISRRITEHEYLTVILFSAFILSAILIVSLDLFLNFKINREKQVEFDAVKNEINFWQDQVSKNQNFRDGYFKLALLEYRLGNLVNARNYLNKTMSFDPNFKEGITLKKILDK